MDSLHQAILCTIARTTVQQQPRNETGRQLPDINERLVIRRLDELRPHPIYFRHGLALSASQLSALAALDDRVSQEPIAITRDGLIIDGYARMERARMLDRTTILCIEYDRTEEEALGDLLQAHLGSNRLNDFCRILLARELEPWFRKKALANQKAGGENKGSSKLTEGEGLDIRSEVARAAGVSTGNVTKVKQIMKTPNSKLQEALRAGQISIHKAWQWRQLSPERQIKELELYLSQKGTNRVIRQLIKRHVAKGSPIPTNQPNLGDVLKCRPLHESGELASISVVVIDAPENIAFLTKGALRILGSLKE